jgi:succinate-acetate transporter protein
MRIGHNYGRRQMTTQLPDEHTRQVEFEPAETELPNPLAGDPAVIGVPTFVCGSIALALTLTGYVSAKAAGAPIAIILAATGIGQVISAVWSSRLGQNAVASVFGIFGGFWLSYAALVLGLTHNWYGVPTADVVHTQGEFLLSWFIIIVMLTLGTLRLPSAFTLLFVLVDFALILVYLGTVEASSGLTKAGGYFVFAFAAVGVYLFFNASSLATGGQGIPLGRPIKR